MPYGSGGAFKMIAGRTLFGFTILAALAACANTNPAVSATA